VSANQAAKPLDGVLERWSAVSITPSHALSRRKKMIVAQPFATLAR
jgi:hypothetical protein